MLWTGHARSSYLQAGPRSYFGVSLDSTEYSLLTISRVHCSKWHFWVAGTFSLGSKAASAIGSQHFISVEFKYQHHSFHVSIRLTM